MYSLQLFGIMSLIYFYTMGDSSPFLTGTTWKTLLETDFDLLLPFKQK